MGDVRESGRPISFILYASFRVERAHESRGRVRFFLMDDFIHNQFVASDLFARREGVRIT